MLPYQRHLIQSLTMHLRSSYLNACSLDPHYANWPAHFAPLSKRCGTKLTGIALKLLRKKDIVRHVQGCEQTPGYSLSQRIAFAASNTLLPKRGTRTARPLVE